MSRRLAVALLALPVFALAACGGDSPTAPSDPCSQSISDDIQNRGMYDTRTENGDTTTLHWGSTVITYERVSASSCFVSLPHQG